MKIFQVPLRVVFYQEEGRWVAHCLEFDLCGDGDTRQAAVTSLLESIKLQVAETIEHDNPANLFSPAPGEIQEKFFAGKKATIGELHLRIESLDHIIFEGPEFREYSDEPGLALI